MINLNPLVVEHHSIRPPEDAPADEYLDCAWYMITEKVNYLPGGMVTGKVSSKVCFRDLPDGLQTHVIAPFRLDIRDRWSIGGSVPGEMAPELAREEGLYLREDRDVKCSVLTARIVRKNMDHARKVMVEEILERADRSRVERSGAGYGATNGLTWPAEV